MQPPPPPQTSRHCRLQSGDSAVGALESSGGKKPRGSTRTSELFSYEVKMVLVFLSGKAESKSHNMLMPLCPCLLLLLASSSSDNWHFVMAQRVGADTSPSETIFNRELQPCVLQICCQSCKAASLVPLVSQLNEDLIEFLQEN